MKLFEVWIEGTSPLLQHRFTESAESASGAMTRRIEIKRELPRDQAEKAAYRDKDTNLYFPSAAITKMLSGAGSSHKQKGSRKSMKYVLPSAVLCPHERINLYNMDRKTKISDFEVDSRSVVIPATKGRIMRHRPRLDAWTAQFDLRVNEDLIDPAFVRQLLSEGGVSLGVGDFRPEKFGPFGTFSIVSWEEAVPSKKAA